MSPYDGTGQIRPKTDVVVDLHIHIGAEVDPVLLIVSLVSRLISVPETSLAQHVEIGIEPHVLVASCGVQSYSLLIGEITDKHVVPVRVRIKVAATILEAFDSLF